MREIRLEGRGRVRKGKGQKHTLQPTELIYRMCRGWGSILNPTISAISSLIPLSRMWWTSLIIYYRHETYVYIHIHTYIEISSVQFSRSVVSNSLWPHEPQHSRPPCPSPTLGVYLNSYPLSRWCRLTISSSVVPFSSRLQSFPASGSFQMSQLFISGGQNIGVLASTSVLPMNT